MGGFRFFIVFSCRLGREVFFIYSEVSCGLGFLGSFYLFYVIVKFKVKAGIIREGVFVTYVLEYVVFWDDVLGEEGG